MRSSIIGPAEHAELIVHANQAIEGKDYSRALGIVDHISIENSSADLLAIRLLGNFRLGKLDLAREIARMGHERFPADSRFTQTLQSLEHIQMCEEKIIHTTLRVQEITSRLKVISAADYLSENTNAGDWIPLDSLPRAFPETKLPWTQHERPPRLRVYRLRDIALLGSGTIPLTENHCILREGMLHGPLNDHLADAGVAALLRQQPLKFESPILSLCNLWSVEFFHWMTETLPLVLLAEQVGFSGKYLIPNCALPYVYETLDLLGVETSRVVRHQGDPIVAQELWLPEKFYAASLWLYPEVVVSLRQALLKHVETDHQTPRRIYASRNKTFNRPRHVENESALQKILREFHFETIYLEDLTFRDQLRYIANAEAFIGPHGAAFAHSMFLPKNSLVLEMFPSAYVDPCAIPINAILEHRYRAIPSRVLDPETQLSQNVQAPIDLLYWYLSTELETR